MKSLNQIKKELATVENRINANTNKIEELTLMDARRDAAQAGDMDAHKRIYAEYKNNMEEIKKLSDKIYVDKVAAKYLLDNYKVALFEACKPAIIEVLTKYNNKPYGDKTREKIKKELEEKTGCYIYIHGYEINIRHKENYYQDVRVVTHYDKPVITKENKIDAGALDEMHTHEVYTENTQKAAHELIKVYNKARKLLEQTNAALNEYNKLIPGDMEYKYINSHLYKTII